MNRLPAAILFALCASSPAAASIIYTTGGSPPTFSTAPANAWFMSNPDDWSVVAESFVPDETVELGQIDLPLQYLSGTNAVTVSIYSGDSEPTTSIESFTLAAPLTASLVNIESITHPQLIAGTTYWIVVSITGDTFAKWFVDPFGPRGTLIQYQGGPGWIDSDGSTKGSVQLLSAEVETPEPSSAVLSVLGAALFLAGIRRKRA